MKGKTRKLYVLENKVWDANDYLNGRNTDPHRTDVYLYATEKEAKKKAMSLDVDKESNTLLKYMVRDGLKVKCYYKEDKR